MRKIQFIRIQHLLFILRLLSFSIERQETTFSWLLTTKVAFIVFIIQKIVLFTYVGRSMDLTYYDLGKTLRHEYQNFLRRNHNRYTA